MNTVELWDRSRCEQSFSWKSKFWKKKEKRKKRKIFSFLLL